MSDTAVDLPEGREPFDPNEWVKMRHPETGGEQDTLRAAYDETWQELGWVLVESGASRDELLALPRRELVERAEKAGLEVGTRATKGDLADAIISGGAS